MIAGIFLGVMIGVASMLLLAMYLANKPKTETKPATTFSAVGVDLSGNTASMESHHAKMLENVLRSASDHKLWERFQTRH
jgi:hypothetical protein